MLSSTPAAEGGCNEFRGQGGFSADSLHQQQQKGIPAGMAFQEVLGSIATPAAFEEASSEDPNKKIRKPYTITKSRESWTEQEHDKFLEALQLFDRDWKKIEAFVGSKTVIQIRSHAQKYFLKVQKNGTSEHVPPPRPKRKAAHPYPQKASKNGNQVSQPTNSFQTSPCLPEPSYTLKSDRSSAIRNSTSATISSWVPVQPIDVLHTIKEDAGPSGSMLLNNSSSSSSTENPPRTRQNCETAEQGHHGSSVRAMPDFARVYSFIGSIFDPSKRGHLNNLMEMDPIDVETVLLLMRNLSVNLTNPDFEDHQVFLHSRCSSTIGVPQQQVFLHNRCSSTAGVPPQQVFLNNRCSSTAGAPPQQVFLHSRCSSTIGVPQQRVTSRRPDTAAAAVGDFPTSRYSSSSSRRLPDVQIQQQRQ